MADEPNDVFATNCYELLLLLKAVQLAVCKVVAYQLASFHPKGDKGIATSYRAHIDRAFQEVGIEIGYVRTCLANPCHQLLLKTWQGFRLGVRGQDEGIAVPKDLVAAGSPYFARLLVFLLQHLVLLSGVEALSGKPFV